MHTRMHPVFWEGKGKGKHETEKFYKGKIMLFLEVDESKKKSLRVAEGLKVKMLITNRIVFLFFFLVE